MAKKKTETPEALERLYTIPLRSEWHKGPSTKRAGAAVTAIRKFLIRHTKAGTVKISEKLNAKIWIRGLKKPPANIRVKAHADDKGVVTAMLPDEVIEKAEKKGKVEKLKERFKGKKYIPKEDGKPAEEAKEGEKTTEETPAEGAEEGGEAKPEEKKEAPKEEKPEGEKAPGKEDKPEKQ